MPGLILICRRGSTSLKLPCRSRPYSFQEPGTSAMSQFDSPPEASTSSGQPKGQYAQAPVVTEDSLRWRPKYVFRPPPLGPGLGPGVRQLRVPAKPKNIVHTITGWDPYAFKLPSYRPGRKMITFIVVTTSLYAGVRYDRKEAKRMAAEYLEQVKEMGRQPIAGMEEVPRCINVLTTTLPEDTERDRSAIYFKKYIKPMLHAAGVDYEIHTGKMPGNLARKLIDEIRTRRLEEEAKRPIEQPVPGTADYVRTVRRLQEIQGGTLIIGHNTLKEYLYALRKGWLSELDLVQAARDNDEPDAALSARLAKLHVFDDPADQLNSDGPNVGNIDDEPAPPVLTRLQPQSAAPEAGSVSRWSSWLKPAVQPPPLPAFELNPPFEVDAPEPTPRILPAPAQLPTQPPIAIVAYDHPLGSMRWWPLKSWRLLFGERERVRRGAETALAILNCHTRPLRGPSDQRYILARTGSELGAVGELEAPQDNFLTEEGKMKDYDYTPLESGTDLDIGSDAELHYIRAFRKWPETIASSRKEWYTQLPKKLALARELARGDREPTKEEVKYPPITETELRQQQLDKERRWQNEEEGWKVTRAGSKVAWDERMEEALYLFVKSSEEE
ncbi:uncharacterized protein L969DRAFT_97173 [Mixia osmundae IAM 14324]|uniref:Mitochondrial import inner membrane translocase subunit TIM54 n=1 Tax=Mixia osmundae (strain CBS 9802 / IAM 14324 / JCM 22182 / KY 12970) TaxID=764103 RepID=G7DW59_MIXOS|nr:uncharacterized protein L969DRAFT_97173 [Mixia osmundae IAM 14324]KEI36438.1 hypothetical protein L969DRAFT_97173 [Mixia osmundae IAM 14324]GAA94865.1 hypothetical protein E5Q_01519 [Mixia osmundae IAM 14324]